MNYTEYTVDDFLTDEFFVKWVREPDEETDHFWRKWLKSNPEKLAEVNQAKQLVQGIRYQRKYEMDDTLYTEMFEGIIKSEERNHLQRAFKPTVFRNWFKSVAAVAILAMGMGATYQWFVPDPDGPSVTAGTEGTNYIAKTSAKGSKVTFTLKDGTKVKLNSESILRYPEDFGDSLRVVHLKGEAFFEVAEDPEKPFVVMTDSIEAMVLGTSFNVRYYSHLEIALVTGKLQVSDKIGRKIMLNPDEMVAYRPDGNMNIGNFDKQETLGWKDNILVFSKADFETVVSNLERWYGVEVETAKGLQVKGHYSGVFENEPLTNVLKGISITSGFTYEIKGKKVFINQ